MFAGAVRRFSVRPVLLVPLLTAAHDRSGRRAFCLDEGSSDSGSGSNLVVKKDAIVGAFRQVVSSPFFNPLVILRTSRLISAIIHISFIYKLQADSIEETRVRKAAARLKIAQDLYTGDISSDGSSREVINSKVDDKVTTISPNNVHSKEKSLLRKQGESVRGAKLSYELIRRVYHNVFFFAPLFARSSPIHVSLTPFRSL